MAKRYCGMCDEWVKGKECPKCGADTDKAAPAPKPVDLMDALRRALPKQAPKCEACGFLMCEEFDYREERGMTLATPNGRYSCLHCKGKLEE